MSDRIVPVAGRSIVRVTPIIGMEIHVELAAASKMFAGVASPAAAATGHDLEDVAPNTLVDPVVLALPGSLPVMNKAALDMAILVGLSLGCEISRESVWDRKHYTYPDLPKGYQISQLAQPICGPGVVQVPTLDSAGFPDLAQPATRVRIARAHLEEDAGKLLHEAPGGEKLDFSIVDYNRAGTALLEIVSMPDIQSSNEAVSYARMIRGICIALGVTRGIMQRGHMRFEPNINCELALSDGSTVRTPIVEVKNLNSFNALRRAIEFELAEQPKRYEQSGVVHASGAKTTRGWDDVRLCTFVQREKEEAHDYRYMPDPDLPPVLVDDAWLARLREQLPVLPMVLYEKFQRVYGLAPKEAWALADEPPEAQRVEAIASCARELGVAEGKAGKLASTLVLQWERSREPSGVRSISERDADKLKHHPRSLDASMLGAVAAMRDKGELAPQAGDALLDSLLQEVLLHEASLPSAATPSSAVAFMQQRAAKLGLLLVRDDSQMNTWIAAAIAAHPAAAADVRAGKAAAIGRLVGEVVKQAQGKADAAWAREKLIEALKA